MNALLTGVTICPPLCCFLYTVGFQGLPAFGKTVLMFVLWILWILMGACQTSPFRANLRIVNSEICSSDVFSPFKSQLALSWWWCLSGVKQHFGPKDSVDSQITGSSPPLQARESKAERKYRAGKPGTGRETGGESGKTSQRGDHQTGSVSGMFGSPALPACSPARHRIIGEKTYMGANNPLSGALKELF